MNQQHTDNSDLPSSTTLVHSVQTQDILCGRGTQSARHPGNIQFRELIHKCHKEYASSTKMQQKDNIARAIFNKLEARNARFLVKVTALEIKQALGLSMNQDVWQLLDTSSIIEKIKQALRDHSKKTHGKKRSTTKDQSSFASSSSSSGAPSPREAKRPRLDLSSASSLLAPAAHSLLGGAVQPATQPSLLDRLRAHVALNNGATLQSLVATSQCAASPPLTMAPTTTTTTDDILTRLQLFSSIVEKELLLDKIQRLQLELGLGHRTVARPTLDATALLQQQRRLSTTHEAAAREILARKLQDIQCTKSQE